MILFGADENGVAAAERFAEWEPHFQRVLHDMLRTPELQGAVKQVHREMVARQRQAGMVDLTQPNALMFVSRLQGTAMGLSRALAILEELSEPEPKVDPEEGNENG